MKTPANVQILERNGKPEFVVIPYEEYIQLVGEEVTIPHEVVELVIKKNVNLVRAWRMHLGLTQNEVAKRVGITQAALSQMERTYNEHHTATLKKLADAMGILVDQLTD